jgi:hypothetical protein
MLEASAGLTRDELGKGACGYQRRNRVRKGENLTPTKIGNFVSHSILKAPMKLGMNVQGVQN